MLFYSYLIQVYDMPLRITLSNILSTCTFNST